MPTSPEKSSRMSPENQWLVQMYFLLKLGGGNSNIFYVHPYPWGFMIQIDLSIFFKWVETQPQPMKGCPFFGCEFVTFRGCILLEDWHICSPTGWELLPWLLQPWSLTIWTSFPIWNKNKVPLYLGLKKQKWNLKEGLTTVDLYL